MRYLLAFGPSPAAALLAVDTHAAMAAAGHRRVGEDVLLSHHLLPQTIATAPEVVIASRDLVGDVPVGEAIVSLRKALPGVRVMLLLGTLDPEAHALAAECVRVGVVDLLHGTVRPGDIPKSLEVSPDGAEVAKLLVPAVATEAARQRGERGRVVAAIGARPGVGVSTVAANLGWLLAARGLAVEALDLSPVPSLGDRLFAEGHGPRAVGLRGIGVTTLGIGGESDEVPRVLEETAGRAAWTVCDLPPDPSHPVASAVLAALQPEDRLVLITTPDPIVLTAAAEHMERLPRERTILVLNRSVSGFPVGPAQVQALCGQAPALILPDDAMAHWSALRGRTVAAERDARSWTRLLDDLLRGRADRLASLLGRLPRLRAR